MARHLHARARVERPKAEIVRDPAIAGLLALGCLLLASSAGAHGLIESSEPRAGAPLERSPKRVVVTFTEAPSDARLTVTDGCDDKVSLRTTIDGRVVSTAITTEGEPPWKVRVQAVSSVDGHITRESFHFGRMSKPDCAVQQEEPPQDDGDGGEGKGAPTGDKISAGEPPGEKASPQEDSGGVPLLPVAAGAAVLAVAGGVWVSRARSAR